MEFAWKQILNAYLDYLYERHKASTSEITNLKTPPSLSFMCKNKEMTIKQATCKQIYWSEIDKILEHLFTDLFRKEIVPRSSEYLHLP